jgi:PAS domain S-box-containing protein
MGASAGGFDALRRFMATIAPDSGLAFVLIQHLDPTHESLTAERLRRHTSMPVAQAEEDVRIEPNHVYVIPPNRYLTISDGRLHVSPPAQPRGLRMPMVVYPEQDTELRKPDQDPEGRATRRRTEVRRLIEAAADAMVVVNASGRILEANHRTEELFGWRLAELLDQPLEVLLPERFREGHVADRSRYFETPAARPMGAASELFGRRQDGSEFAIDVQLSPMEMNDEPVAVAAIRDVTERKLAEAMRTQFAAIVQSSGAGILLMDLDGTIRNWNPGAERLFGYTVADAIGRSVEILLPPERQEEFPNEVNRLLRNEPMEDFETVRLHRNGTRIDVALTVSLVREGTRPTGLCVIYTDIRPRKRLEQKVAELLEQEHQRVGRELHDTLGQQLTAVGMLVSSLKTQLGPRSGQSEAVSRLEQAVELSKVQLRSLIAGTFPVAVDAERLTWVLRDLAHETSRIYGVPCRFEGGEVTLDDPFAATQLFLTAREAVHNAVRHAKAQEIVIRLEGDGRIGLSVHDNGRGIPSEVDESETMGLRIMRYRCGLIGARLLIEPNPAGGTVVTIALRPK